MTSFTRNLKDTIRDCTALGAGVGRNGSKSPGNRALIAPASNAGSLGDAAMIIGLATLLKKRGLNVALASDEVGEWHLPFEVEGFETPPSGGLSWISWGRALRNIDYFFLNGADVLDGKYSLGRSLGRLKLVDFVARAGVPATITGFSLREDLPDAIIAAFRRLPPSVRLCLRDPASKRRMEETVGRECHQVADLAFLVEPQVVTGADIEVVERIERDKANGKTVLGFCPNLHAVVSGDTSHSARADVLVEYFRGIVSKCAQLGDYSFVLVPHDYRGQWNDLEVCERVFEQSGLTADQGFVVKQELRPGAVKGIVGRLDALITGRMHCGIAALGQGTPTIFLDYQGKVDGLLEFFGLSTKVRLEENLAAVCNATGEHLKEIRDRGDAYRGEIQTRLTRVRELSAANWP